MSDPDPQLLRFRGGATGALAPFAAFLAGVAALGLSGAPDERGLWPILLAALGLGLLLACDRDRYSETVIAGMARPIVLLMVLAWLLAGVFGALLTASDLVTSLTGLARDLGVAGSGWVAASFLVACIFSSATGTSLGTLILCFPLLYPAGPALGADPLWLAGAILGGATFGDNISPVSDTTIASASTQGVDLGGTVRSRMRYALPAAAVALVLYLIPRGGPSIGLATETLPLGGLVMLLAPAVMFTLLLRRHHLVEGLFAGIAIALLLGLATGQLTPSALFRVEAGSFGARGLLVEGVERGLGISVFTLLMTGLVAAMEASGLVQRAVDAAGRRVADERGAEVSIVLAASAAVMLTAHSVVAILTTGRFARRTGRRFGVEGYRRANLLDLTVCTWPFLLPWFIPTILAASLTGATPGSPRLSAFAIGLVNFHSWGLLVMLALAVLAGYGRRSGA
jgi:Na+/H+ antiporter NhaC